MSDRRRTKVVFSLEPETDDWPPVATEGVWARPLGNDEYELDNVPWFARGVACGDRVRADSEDGMLVVREQIAWSGRYTIRVIPLGDAPARDQRLGERIREDVKQTREQLKLAADMPLPSSSRASQR
jgi:hypothetical protein